MKKFLIGLVALMVAACGSPESGVDANEMILSIEMAPVTDRVTETAPSGTITSLRLVAREDIEVRRLTFEFYGSDPTQYIVGSAGTAYFTQWELRANPSGAGLQTLMGPIEPLNGLPAATVNSGPIKFTDLFVLEREQHLDLFMETRFSRVEDAPGEFVTEDRLYRLKLLPVREGDVTFVSDGTAVPLEQIEIVGSQSPVTSVYMSAQ